MLESIQEIHERVEAAARQHGSLAFKDEGRNESGVTIGKLTLYSSGSPVYSDGRWVTITQALQLSAAWGVELFEY